MVETLAGYSTEIKEESHSKNMFYIKESLKISCIKYD